MHVFLFTTICAQFYIKKVYLRFCRHSHSAAHPLHPGESMYKDTDSISPKRVRQRLHKKNFSQLRWASRTSSIYLVTPPFLTLRHPVSLNFFCFPLRLSVSLPTLMLLMLMVMHLLLLSYSFVYSCQ